MVLFKDKREPLVELGAEGGFGTLVLDKFNGKAVNPANVRLYAYATLEPGAKVGYHIHKGESEIYYILSGRGLYSDNGCERAVAPGDVTFTPDGEGHSIENIGDSVFEFMALVVAE